jgi:hypothetical protein
MNYLDEKTYSANVNALRELTENAKELTQYWEQLNLEPMTAEIYQQWLTDKELIFETYKDEKLKTIDKVVWEGLSENVKRPMLDDKKFNGRFDRLFSMAGRYSGGMDGTRIFISVADVEFLNGEPEISDKKLKELKQKCTVKVTANQKPFIETLQNYCDNFQKLQAESLKLFGINLEVMELLVAYDGKKTAIDMTKLADLFFWLTKKNWI